MGEAGGGRARRPVPLHRVRLLRVCVPVADPARGDPPGGQARAAARRRGNSPCVTETAHPPRLPLAPAPHIGVRLSTARMSWMVCLCLLPSAAWGVFLFGLPALGVLGVSIGAAALAELAATLPFRPLHPGGRQRRPDGLHRRPPRAGRRAPVRAGGRVGLRDPRRQAELRRPGEELDESRHGGNRVRLPLVARPPGTVGGAAGRRPPGHGAAAAGSAARRSCRSVSRDGSSLAVLSHSGYAFSGIDAQVVGWINAHLLSPLGLALQPGSFDVLVGHVAGGIGTVSIPLLLLGAWYLLSRGVIRWHLPVAVPRHVLRAVGGVWRSRRRTGAGLPEGRYSSSSREASSWGLSTRHRIPSRRP